MMVRHTTIGRAFWFVGSLYALGLLVQWVIVSRDYEVGGNKGLRSGTNDLVRIVANLNSERLRRAVANRRRIHRQTGYQHIQSGNRRRILAIPDDGSLYEKTENGGMVRSEDDEGETLGGVVVVVVEGRTVWVSSRDLARRERIHHSERYDSLRHRKYRPYQNFTECQPMHDWQVKSFPTCNNLHELHMAELSDSHQTQRQMYLLGSGFFRDVWGVRDYDDAQLVLKTLRLEHDFDEQNLDRHRKDAVAMERLTFSEHVFDIYGYCGQSGFFEYGNSGNINDAIWNEAFGKLNSVERLVIASQVAEAVADVHSVGGEFASIAHTDIMTDQFIFVDGVYKLNDFNRCFFLYWNTTSNNGTCPYYYEDYNAWLVSAILFWMVSRRRPHNPS